LNLRPSQSLQRLYRSALSALETPSLTSAAVLGSAAWIGTAIPAAALLDPTGGSSQSDVTMSLRSALLGINDSAAGFGVVNTISPSTARANLPTLERLAALRDNARAVTVRVQPIVVHIDPKVARAAVASTSPSDTSSTAATASSSTPESSEDAAQVASQDASHPRDDVAPSFTSVAASPQPAPPSAGSSVPDQPTTPVSPGVDARLNDGGGAPAGLTLDAGGSQAAADSKGTTAAGPVNTNGITAAASTNAGTGGSGTGASQTGSSGSQTGGNVSVASTTHGKSGSGGNGKHVGQTGDPQPGDRGRRDEHGAGSGNAGAGQSNAGGQGNGQGTPGDAQSNAGGNGNGQANGVGQSNAGGNGNDKH
jgi:hypothetical protein